MAATIKDIFKINSLVQDCFPFLNPIQNYDDDKIIITESMNLALVYDLNKMFCLKSFTFTSLMPLTAPMVYDSLSEQLVVVKNKTKLELIKNGDENEEVNSIKLDKDQQIKCILTGHNCPSLIVFENNKLCLLDKVIKSRSINFKNDCVELESPSKHSSLARLIVVASANNNLKFWSLFVDDKHKKHHYVLFNYNFILNELLINSRIDLKNPDQFKSISFSSDNLLTIDKDNNSNILNASSNPELLFDLNLKDEQFIDHGYLQLENNICALALLTYSQTSNRNHLLAYDLNLKKEMKRVELPIESEHQSVKLIVFGSKLFVQTNNCLIYVPVESEQLSLADLIKSYKSELNLNAKDLKFDKILKLLDGGDVKPIDKEYLLADALEKFINVNKELNANGVSDSNDAILSANLSKKLDRLFSYSFNSDFMIEQLKQKQFNRDFLLKVLNLLNRALNSCELVNCIDWINVIFDSYFIILNSSNNQELVNVLNNIKERTEQLILKSKSEKDLKFLLDTLVLGLQDESSKYKPEIIFPDTKRLGYKLDEITL